MASLFFTTNQYRFPSRPTPTTFLEQMKNEETGMSTTSFKGTSHL